MPELGRRTFRAFATAATAAFAGMSIPATAADPPPPPLAFVATGGADVTSLVAQHPDGAAIERQNALTVYPFGTPAGGSLLREGRYILDADGGFQFRPPGSETTRAGVLPLAGSWRPAAGKARSIHALRRSGFGATLSLDGWLFAEAGGRSRLDAVHAVSFGAWRQVERVVLDLVPAPLLAADTAERADTATGEAGEARRKVARAGQTSDEPSPEGSGPGDSGSEDSGAAGVFDQQEYVEGIPLLTIWDVSLEGTVDDVAFGPLPGLLMIHGREPGTDRIGVSLATKDFDATGALVFGNDRSPPPTGQTIETVVAGSVEVKGDTLRLDLTAEEPGDPGSPMWRAPERPGPTSAGDLGFVSLRQARLTLRVAGGEVRGELAAEGARQPLLTEASTYRAEFGGHRQGSDRVREARRRLGAYRFDGEWHPTGGTPPGVLRLTQEGRAISGTWGEGAGRLEGEQADGLAEFRWREDGTAGDGFLRALPGGRRLVGYRLSTDAQPPRVAPLLYAAVGEGEGDLPARTAAAVPAATEEIREARRLAIDLALADKCVQATGMLGPIYGAYKADFEARLARGELDALGVDERLVELTWAQQPLIQCASRQGDYPALVSLLRDAVRIERLKGPEQDMRRLLETRVAAGLREAGGRNETLLLLHDGYERWRGALGAAGVGISFGEPGGTGAVLTGVMPDRPAARAGLREGDVLQAVDGRAVAELDGAGLMALLQGSAGSTVRLTVTRDGRPLERTLRRTPLSPLPPDRQARLGGAIDAELADIDHARSILAGAPDVATLRAGIGAGPGIGVEPGSGAGPGAAPSLAGLLALRDDTRARADALDALQRQAEARATAFWAAHPPIVEHIRRQNALLARVANAGTASVPAEELRAADASESRLEAYLQESSDLQWIEKQLPMAELQTQGLLIGAAQALRLAADFIDRSAPEKREQERREMLAQSVPRLEDWLEQWRARLGTDQAKIAALDAGQPFFDDVVALQLELGEGSAALAMAEAARGRAFRDLLAGRRAPDAPAGDTGEAPPAIASAPTAPGPIASAPLASAGPALRSYEAAPALTVGQIEGRAAELGTAFLVYRMLADRLVIWVVAPTGGITPRVLPIPRERLIADVAAFRDLVRPLPPGAEGARMIVPRARRQDEVARRLYDVLIAPVAEFLPADTDVPVTVVPDRELLALSFAALLGPDGRRLIERHPLVLAPSVALAGDTRPPGERPAEHPRSLLALVNPRPFGVPEGSSATGLPPLARTEAGLDRITRFYGPDTDGRSRVVVRTGQEASIAALRADGARHSVIYFATHGEAAAEPERAMTGSYLALAGAPLRALDLFGGGLRLDSELVVLGACHTAGGSISGDGINGLARGFAFAGAASLLTTLWEAQEERTLEFLERFHHDWLVEGRSKAAAAQSAQVALLHDYPAQTEIWAPFVLFGAWR